MNHLERLAELIWLREFQAGETLINFNEIQTSVLIFVEGRAVGTREQRVAICDAGTVFGETSLIDALPSEIKLTAETEGALWQLDAAAFEQFAHEYPKAALALTTTIARTLLRKTKERRGYLIPF